MSKLLRANFARLFKSLIFRIMMLLSILLSVFFPLKRYWDMINQPEYFAELPDSFKCAEGFAFSAPLHIIFFVAVVIGSYVGTEYSNGTIRNKILVGNERYNIYIANFITCAAAGVILLFAEMACMFAVGKIVFTVSIMSVGEIVTYFFFECLTMVALTAILVMMTMLIPNKAASSVVVLITVFILFGAALTINDRLEQPEYYSDYEMTSVDDAGNPVIEKQWWKNPYYADGMKRKVYEFLYDFLPVCQFVQISYDKYDRIPVMAVYSCLLCVVCTGGGVMAFDRKDLK